MNVKALALTGATVGVAVVTLVGLNLVAPITHAEEGHAALVPADSVFAASIAEPGADAVTAEMEVAQAETAAQPEAPATAPSSESAAATMDVAQAEPVAEPAPAVEAAPEAVASEPGTEAPAIDSEPYAAMADAEPMANGGEPVVAAGACSTGLVDPSQPPVIVMASGLPDSAGDAPAGDMAGAGEMPADTAAAVEPAAPAPEPMAEAPAPAATPEPVVSEAAAEPEPAPAVVEAPKPKPKAVAKKAPKVQPPEAQLVWWPAAKDGKLNLTYAGSASFTKAVALIFDGTHADGSKATAHIKVTTKDGRPVPGQWLVANGNSRMLLYSVPPGIYRVSVDAGMSDQDDRTVASASSGLVYVP